MKKNNLMQHFFCARKIIKIIPTLLIAVLLLTLTYFTPGIKSIFGQDNSKILICIDPGHGGKDHGATGPTGLKEKDVNLDISFKLRDKLAGSGFAVIMTREDDTKKSLDDIVNIANASNADIFISVHNNSHTLREKNGTETFYFSQSPGSYFLASYVNTRTIEQIGTLNRGVKSANFKELRNTKMTSALVEGAFISNPDEEAKLNDPGFRERIAEGIYNGIVEYLNKNGESVLINKKISSAQSFIRRVYQKSLNLDPDQATLDNLADKLAAGTISHADVIKGVILSKQFKDLNLSETQFINVLYGAVLDRNPDPAGEAHWLKQLKILDRAAVLNYFLTSAE
ncbi:MAG: DUF4214 domain-containing protein, partial [Actinobacteria bacterium]|nr:DUF4214 domain-containing protein [Actinomycetota bacterium]